MPNGFTHSTYGDFYHDEKTYDFGFFIGSEEAIPVSEFKPLIDWFKKIGIYVGEPTIITEVLLL